MIAKVLPRRGSGGQTRASGRRLMAYLLGPGDKPATHTAPTGGVEFGELGNTHTQPRVVATWDPVRSGEWAQACASVDWADPEQAWAVLGSLSRQIADAAAGDLDQVRGGLARNGIWHTVMAAHPQDGELTDAQWAQVAERLMHETGLHPFGSDNPVRWVAARHGLNEAGADHIHVMAVLVRADGSKPRMHNDALAAQRAARWAEAEFGLVPGRGRAEATQDRESPLRADTAPSRGEMAAAAKRGPLYPRPAGMSDEVWDQVAREGRDRAWTRQGLARGAVLSAAARAVSTEHLIDLMTQQGYGVRLRYSTKNPGEVTGWSVVAPPERQGGRPKSYRGAALGADCAWPKVAAHIERLAEARGTGLVGEELEDAVISREKMVAAGWGVTMIDQVLDADRMLAEGVGSPEQAYWLRDAFWQVAWELEGRLRMHGVFTDAAYAYAAVAVGGVPPVPAEAIEAMTALRTQYDQVLARLDQLDREGEVRDAEARALTRAAREWDSRADSFEAEARPHVPYYLTLPGGARMTGTAWVRTSIARQNIRRHSAALAQASAVHRANSARRRELTAVELAAFREVETLRGWVAEAKAYEGQLQDAMDEHAAARGEWRAAIGRLLVDARALGDVEAEAQVVAVDARYGPDRVGVGGTDFRPLYGGVGAR